MKRKSLLLFSVAALLILTTFISSAAAYFTTYADAKGGITLHLQGEHHMEEDFSDWTKHVRIASTGGLDCYVRARAFGPPQYPLVYEYPDGKWTPGADGWYYYDEVLHGGDKTTDLNVHITGVPKSAEADPGSKFDVVVVYECIPVTYDSNGDPLPPDWSQAGSGPAAG